MTQQWHLRWLLHNVVVHPVCGLLWFVGFERAADRLHSWPKHMEGAA